jgi:glycogen debranching enzyme
LRGVLASEVLPKLRLHEFFQVNVEKIVEEFKKHCRGKEKGIESKSGDLFVQQDPLYRRFGSTVDLDLAVNLFYSKYVNGLPEEEQIERSAELLICKLHAINHDKYNESLGHIDAILNATMGHVFYERVDGNGPRIPRVDKNKTLTTK